MTHAPGTSPGPLELARELWRRLPRDLPFLTRARLTMRPVTTPFGDVLSWIPERASIMDIGCGRGTLLGLALLLRSPVSLAGLEIDSKLVEYTRAMLDHLGAGRLANVSVYDGRTIDERVTGADCVVLLDVLHHVPPPSQRGLLLDIFTAMRPGARFILKDIDGGSPLVIFNRVHDLVFSREIVHELAMSDTASYLQEIGFVIENIRCRRVVWYPHYTLVCGKPQ